MTEGEPRPEMKTTYSLMAEDFSPDKAPSEIVKFKPGDRITRDNFVSMLSKSFAASGENSHLQFVYFTWLEMQHGFDYRTTFANMSAAGGFGALSSLEHKFFLADFKSIMSTGGDKKSGHDVVVEGEEAELGGPIDDEQLSRTLIEEADITISEVLGWSRTEAAIVSQLHDQLQNAVTWTEFKNILFTAVEA